MEIYYITEASNKEDILFWSADLKTGERVLSCLAFFYKKEFAECYKEYIQKNGELDLIIRTLTIK